MGSLVHIGQKININTFSETTKKRHLVVRSNKRAVGVYSVYNLVMAVSSRFVMFESRSILLSLSLFGARGVANLVVWYLTMYQSFGNSLCSMCSDIRQMLMKKVS